MAELTAMSIEEREARIEEIVARHQELDNEFKGQALPDDAKEEFERLAEEREDHERILEELRAREEYLRASADDPERHDEPAFQVRRPGATRTDNIWDLSSIRSSVGSPQEAVREMHDRARRAVEQAEYGHDRAKKEEVDAHIERLLARADDDQGTIARHILTTGSPAYRRAFRKSLNQQPLNSDEQRAASLASAGGGYAVPYVLDPTIIPTSNLSVNPFRAIADVQQIPGDEWRGVSSAGVTAAYAAEATEANDNAPTLAQPTISTEKAQSNIPYSIEIGMDWSGFETEMARLLQDAKDDLEATKFLSGSGTNEPFGLLTGATTVVTTANTAAFAIADLYSLEAALGPRFRARASFVSNRAQYQLVRAFDTSGGAGIWVPNLTLGPFANAGATEARLNVNVLGYPSYELSSMSAVLTSGALIAVLGDFRYFKIVDRIGMTIENIPHLFGASNRFPTGQRDLYCYWRNGSKVLDANAFRVLKTK